MSTVSVKTFASCTNADIADAILSLAAPLFAACGNDTPMKEHVVSLAVTGWNLSLFEAGEEDGYLKKAEARLPEGLPADKKAVFTRFVLQIIETKQQKYPAMLKGIKNWDLRVEGDTLSLTVDALPVKPV